MKKFSVPCDFGGQKSPFTLYIGEPESSHHPVHFQATWLSKERGGNVPGEVMDSLSKLKELADQNNVSFEELCVYALGAAQEEMGQGEEQQQEGEESSSDQEDVFDEDDEFVTEKDDE